MTYYNWGVSAGTPGTAATGALYYNSTAAFKGRQDGSGMTFSEIMDQSVRRSRTAGTTDLSSPMDDIFEEAAARYGVDVNLLRAIGKAESGFDPSAVSGAGAIGVMQLMPATAGALGVSDPYDARQNIMGGASYIAGLLNQYDGDVSLALAAYNAGSGNVEKYGGIPPFAETQAYVEKVMGYAGQEVTADRQVSAAAGEVTAAEEEQTDFSKYWGQMVDLMRMQLEMKLAGILSSEEEDADQAVSI